MTQRGRPTYVHPPKVRVERRRRLGAELIDNAFFLTAFVAVILLGAVLSRQGLRWSPYLLFLIGVWLLLTYLALPRFHRMMTALYVPDYFFGRSRTNDGLLGDPVNLALLGSESQVHAAMEAAGWTRADSLNISSAWRTIVSSLTRRSYPEAPVSSLHLFGRVQDFAYQMEVDGSPAQRHHVRFWATPEGWLLPGGHRVDWLAAGTYDRSIGFSAFTLQITHKIDADIDLERDFIIDTLTYAEPQVSVNVIEDFSTGYHHRNGGGDAVQTDGNLPVVDVRSVTSEAAPRDSEDDLAHRIGRRPVAVGLGVLLVLTSSVLDMIFYTPEYVSTVQELKEAAPGQYGLLGLAFVIGVLAVAYGVLGLFLWKTFAGRAWARMLLLAQLCSQVVFQLVQWVGSRDVPFGALVSTSCGVLGIFALSSLSARRWTGQAPGRQTVTSVQSGGALPPADQLSDHPAEQPAEQGSGVSGPTPSA